MQLTSDQIQEILPHRYPFLLLDRVTDFEAGKWAEAIKCVSMGEPWTVGHFPGNTIMPGVLILEAIAQAGAVALLTDPRYAGKLAVFGGVKNARFLKRVKPGDVLELRCQITRVLAGVGLGEGTATVNGETVCTGQISFFVTDK